MYDVKIRSMTEASMFIYLRSSFQSHVTSEENAWKLRRIMEEEPTGTFDEYVRAKLHARLCLSHHVPFEGIEGRTTTPREHCYCGKEECTLEGFIHFERHDAFASECYTLLMQIVQLVLSAENSLPRLCVSDRAMSVIQSMFLHHVKRLRFRIDDYPILAMLKYRMCESTLKQLFWHEVLRLKYCMYGVPESSILALNKDAARMYLMTFGQTEKARRMIASLWC